MTSRQLIISTLKPVTKELKRFLTSKESENIVLTGAWGTGKTQAWKRVVNRISCREAEFLHFRVWSFFFFADLFLLYLSSFLYRLTYSYFFSSLLFSLLCWLPFYLLLVILFWRSFSLFSSVFLSKRFSRKRYAYVSASDCATIKDLEDKIFDSVVPRRRAGKSQSPFGSFLLKGTGVTLIVTILVALILLCVLNYQPEWLIKNFKSVEGLSIAAVVTALVAGGAACLQFPFNFWQHYQQRWLLKDAIICIDDIERASKKLEPQEILNLAADLKENKNCKVALILNEDEFYSENKEKLLLISNLEQVNVNNENTLKKAISIAQDKSSESSQKKSKKELWKKALEKGSDSHLELILNSQDAAKLAFIDKNGKEIKDKESALVWALRSQVQEYDVQINNIRIIHHIQKDLERWSVVVAKLSDEDRALKEDSWTQLKKKLGSSRETFEQSLWHKLAIIVIRQGKERYERYGTEGQKADDLTGKIITYLNHFSRRDFKILWSEETEEIKRLIEFCASNIQKGFLLEAEAIKPLEIILEKERKALKNRIEQETDKFQRKIIEVPIRAAIFEDSPKEKITKGLEELEKVLTKNEDFISKIGLSAMNYLLYLAERVDMKKWADTFRNPYMQNMQNFKKQRDDFFSSWPDAILLGKDNEIGLTAYSMPVDQSLKKAFETERDDRKEKRQKEIKEEHEEVRRNKNYLKEALTQLSYSIFSFDFDQYKDFYEGWTLDTLMKTLKEFSPEERLRIAENYWQGCFSTKIPHEYCGMSNIPAQNNILEELKFRNSENNWTDSSQTLEKLRIFRQLGILLYEALDEYRKSDFMMGYDLEQELEKKRWTELDKIKIPTDEEIKEQAEKSLENTDTKEPER